MSLFRVLVIFLFFMGLGLSGLNGNEIRVRGMIFNFFFEKVAKFFFSAFAWRAKAGILKYLGFPMILLLPGVSLELPATG